MKLLRRCFDAMYTAVKPIVFYATAKDPEKAHNLFATSLRILYYLHLDRAVLDNGIGSKRVSVSNAAGFNKNGELPPSTLHYLGFDRVVVGTVTNDEWNGNPRPRSRRYPKTQSLVNWLGLPGEGAAKVAERLIGYRKSAVPLTVNLMSTPGKKGSALLKDLEGTVKEMRQINNVDRFELNISCPNTHSGSGEMDARREYQEGLRDMVVAVQELLMPEQTLYLKVSPDLDKEGVEQILTVVDAYTLAGITTANTTTNHDPAHILNSPGKGGASGNAVYNASLETQRLFHQLKQFSGMGFDIISCGGINSTLRLEERILSGGKEVQVYTPIIFLGTRLLSEFSKYLKKEGLW